MDQVHSVVFMQFDGQRHQIYEEIIKPILTDKCAQVPFLASEETSAENKIDLIKTRIAVADLIVTDVTGQRPAVMWELGYSEAMGKPIVLLNADVGQLPFYLRTRDYLRYSENDLPSFREEFEKRISTVIAHLQTKGRSVVSVRGFASMYAYMKSVVLDINEESLMAEFIWHETERAHAQIARIAAGKYILRNIRPISEIAQHYRRYYGRLKTGHAVRAVACFEFWRDFTEGGTNWDYLNANLEAGQRKTTINRVFIVGKKTFKFGHGFTGEFTLYEKILRRFASHMPADNRDFMARVLIVDNYYKAVEKEYGNFALISRGPEELLMRPVYEGEDVDRRIVNTEFSVSVNLSQSKWQQTAATSEIAEFKGKFEQAKRESQYDLNEFLKKLSPKRRSGKKSRKK